MTGIAAYPDLDTLWREWTEGVQFHFQGAVYRTPALVYLERWCMDGPGNATKERWRLGVRLQICKFKTLAYVVQRRKRGWACSGNTDVEASQPLSLPEAIALVSSLAPASRKGKGGSASPSLTKIYNKLSSGESKEFTPAEHEQAYDWQSC